MSIRDHFLSLSTGSAYEIETQLIIANKLNYINEMVLEEMLIQVTEIQKMIFSFSKRIKESKQL